MSDNSDIIVAYLYLLRWTITERNCVVQGEIQVYCAWFQEEMVWSDLALSPLSEQATGSFNALSCSLMLIL